MKKVNPKITAIVVLLLSLLVSGGVAVHETIGEPTPHNAGDLDDTGLF